MPKKIKIGLALGGGGARGLAHIGVLKALVKANIKIDYIAGTSMGAFMGALYGVGIEVDEMTVEALSFNKRKAMTKLVDVAIPKKSILKGKKVFRYIDDLLDRADFRDLKIPLRIVATDLSNGDQVIINKGNLARAIQASICVPGIFPPVKINNKYLVDGGVANPTPVDQVIDMGADVVIGVDLISRKNAKFKQEPNIVQAMLQSYDIIRNKSINFCEGKKNCNVVIVKPELKGHGVVNSFKFYDIGEFIDEGERAAKVMLPQIKRLIKSLE